MSVMENLSLQRNPLFNIYGLARRLRYPPKAIHLVEHGPSGTRWRVLFATADEATHSHRELEPLHSTGKIITVTRPLSRLQFTIAQSYRLFAIPRRQKVAWAQVRWLCDHEDIFKAYTSHRPLIPGNWTEAEEDVRCWMGETAIQISSPRSDYSIREEREVPQIPHDFSQSQHFEDEAIFSLGGEAEVRIPMCKAKFQPPTEGILCAIDHVQELSEATADTYDLQSRREEGSTEDMTKAETDAARTRKARSRKVKEGRRRTRREEKAHPSNDMQCSAVSEHLSESGARLLQTDAGRKLDDAETSTITSADRDGAFPLSVLQVVEDQLTIPTPPRGFRDDLFSLAGRADSGRFPTDLVQRLAKKIASGQQATELQATFLAMPKGRLGLRTGVEKVDGPLRLVAGCILWYTFTGLIREQDMFHVLSLADGLDQELEARSKRRNSSTSKRSGRRKVGEQAPTTSPTLCGVLKGWVDVATKTAWHCLQVDLLVPMTEWMAGLLPALLHRKLANFSMVMTFIRHAPSWSKRLGEMCKPDLADCTRPEPIAALLTNLLKTAQRSIPHVDLESPDMSLSLQELSRCLEQQVDACIGLITPLHDRERLGSLLIVRHLCLYYYLLPGG